MSNYKIMIAAVKDLGKQIASLRKNKGISQIELAKLSSIPVAAIRRCEQNGAIPLHRYVALAKLLGAEVQVTIRQEEQPFKSLPQMGQRENVLATKLGTTTHTSLLLRKLAKDGLDSPEKLAAAAIDRGCNHYASSVTKTNRRDNPDENSCRVSNEELAMALLSPCLPYNPQWIRIGAQLLSAPINDPKRLAWIAIQDRSASVLKYIAQCGKQTEPDLPFWTEILSQLEAHPPAPPNVVSHISRFRSETGVTDPRTPNARKIIWLRPNSKKLPREQPT